MISIVIKLGRNAEWTLYAVLQLLVTSMRKAVLVEMHHDQVANREGFETVVLIGIGLVASVGLLKVGANFAMNRNNLFSYFSSGFALKVGQEAEVYSVTQGLGVDNSKWQITTRAVHHEVESKLSLCEYSVPLFSGGHQQGTSTCCLRCGWSLQFGHR